MKILQNSEIPIYKQIAAQLKEEILSGKLTAGEYLPSIRGLAKDLKISVICFSKMKPLYAPGTEGTSTTFTGVFLPMQCFGKINLSVGWAIFWHLVLVIVGSFVYYRFMSARYRARSTAVPV